MSGEEELCARGTSINRSHFWPRPGAVRSKRATVAGDVVVFDHGSGARGVIVVKNDYGMPPKSRNEAVFDLASLPFLASHYR